MRTDPPMSVPSSSSEPAPTDRRAARRPARHAIERPRVVRRAESLLKLCRSPDHSGRFVLREDDRQASSRATAEAHPARGRAARGSGEPPVDRILGLDGVLDRDGRPMQWAANSPRRLLVGAAARGGAVDVERATALTGDSEALDAVEMQVEQLAARNLLARIASGQLGGRRSRGHIGHTCSRMHGHRQSAASRQRPTRTRATG